ncbi:helix-turn-helix transcriptional regulator [Bacillus infantis]|uniref:helix-turn-helix transcriptional regulator n=1 Tax=Bacillus TaxID=1386 RepID=UPI001CD3FC65|nr:MULTISPECIES: helix-turn-helix transcriptional regulator [Bacillus]MCA1036676.1 helix-turn-helix transcriptional regulator [Bacillus infantis]MDT0159196.1 helix-turn-helix transcriptional regulator [Bacillus sp. AG4(2022)]
MRNGRVFYKLFIPFFLLGIGLVAGFSIFIYNSTYNSVEESFLKDKESYTKQILHNVEQKVRTIEYGYTAYSSTASFKEVFTRPLSGRDFEVYQDIIKEMSYIEMMGIEGSKYRLISLAEKWGIVNESLKKLTPEEYNAYKEQYINENDRNLFWKPTEEGIEMVMTLPFYQREKFALGIANIPRRSIDQIVGEQDNAVEIYNSQDKLLYSSVNKGSSLTETSFDEVKAAAEAAEEKADVFKADNGKTYVFLEADYNHWLYLVEINENEIGSIIHNTRMGLILASVILILLVGGTSYLLADSYSRPIKKIQERLSQGGISRKQNELSFLAASVDRIVDQNELLTESLSKQKPELETLFVLSLFRKRIAEKDIQHRLEQFDYHFGTDKVFYTGLIQIDQMDGGQNADKDIFLLAINHIVREIVPKEERLIPIVLNDEMQAMIFACDNEQEAERRIMMYYEEIQEKVKETLNLVVSVGVSPVYHSLIDSKKAVDLAKESLHYRVNVGPESIIFYHDISSMLNDASISKFPIELHNELMSAIRSGREEEVRNLTGLLIDEIFRLNKNPISLGVTLIRVINDLVQLGQLLGAESNIFENIKKLYQTAMHAYYPQIIKDMLYQQLIQPVIISTQSNTEQGFKNISDKIVYIIQSEFDQEISLDIIADRLHYNPNYLSNVFKKEYGENFVDYLMNYRLQMAQMWLKETDMTIKEIAEKLQYRNSQNFIRFFKKKVGKTPGDYRKEYRQ